MDRRKKIINSHERVARKLLSEAAEKNGAQVFAKIRVADVLNIDGSALSNEHFTFALRAHFDFCVADMDDLPLFAVEFDGPHHDWHQGSQLNDRRKNVICEQLNFPLARVRDEHLFRRARGVDYLTWLTELFFSSQALIDAQEQGLLPLDALVDPMMFVSHPHIAGRFPLFISAEARNRLRQLHQTGVLQAPVPFYFCGDDPNQSTACVAVLPTTARTYLITESSLYLRGFGVAPSEAAEEIATVNLARMAEECRETRERTVSSINLRATLIDFLRHHDRGQSFGGREFDLGFPVSFKLDGGRGRWYVGPLRGEAPVEIEAHGG